MDPVLTLMLNIAIVATLVFFYFWIRSVARRVDRQNLDRRLEELENSVAETTRWLETASGQIREDLERRMTLLKNLLGEAENRFDDSKPARSQLEFDAEVKLQAAHEERVPASESQPFLPNSPVYVPVQGAKHGLPEAVRESVRMPEPSESAVAVEPLPAGIAARPEAAVPEQGPISAVKAVSTPDRRSLILELAARGLSVADIAKSINASRAEVEMVVAFRRPR